MKEETQIEKTKRIIKEYCEEAIDELLSKPRIERQNAIDVLAIRVQFILHDISKFTELDVQRKYDELRREFANGNMSAQKKLAELKPEKNKANRTQQLFDQVNTLDALKLFLKDKGRADLLEEFVTISSSYVGMARNNRLQAELRNLKIK